VLLERPAFLALAVLLVLIWLIPIWQRLRSSSD